MIKIDMHKFSQLCGLIKSVKRAGWLRYLQPDKVESVADHSSRIALMTFALRGKQNIDYQRCLQMAIMHDLAEGIVGDFTPYCKITPQQKYERQLKAIGQIFSQLGQNGQYFIQRWKQFEEGKCRQSQIVKDLDKYEMIQQAFEYEQKHKVDLSEFYNCIQKMKSQTVIEWSKQLLLKRNQYFQSKQQTNLKQ